MKRRDFLLLSGCAVTAWPATTRAQKATIPAIGFLGSASATGFGPQIDGFRKGLDEAGYAENRDFSILYRWADNQNDRLPALVQDLVHLQVDMIFASDGPSAVVIKDTSTTIPAVFVVGIDPVGAALVNSLSRPRKNMTGMYLYVAG